MKTKDEAIKLRKALQEECDRLPSINAFGGSNIEDKMTMREDIGALDRYISGERIIEDDSNISEWIYEVDDMYDCYFEE